jgi:hypothetical protein
MFCKLNHILAVFAFEVVFLTYFTGSLAGYL